jgi:hypothetical protein
MWIIEACFRRLKTTGLGIRPMFHWTPRRIVAHVKLCVLALMIQRAAEIATGAPWSQLVNILERLKAVRYTAEGETIVQASRISPELAAILKKARHLNAQADPRGRLIRPRTLRTVGTRLRPTPTNALKSRPDSKPFATDRMYGRVPLRKSFLRRSGTSGQLLPCIRPGRGHEDRGPGWDPRPAPEQTRELW